MKILAMVTLLCATAVADIARGQETRNPEVDYAGFQKIVEESRRERESRLLTEAQFIQTLSESGVIVLDARTSDKFRLRHVKGARNLPLPDFTEQALAEIIPAKNAKVVIYCNNNFEGSPVAMAGKRATAALNVHTYTTLRSYGYTNVFELGPRLNVLKTEIPFVGQEVNSEKASTGK